MQILKTYLPGSVHDTKINPDFLRVPQEFTGDLWAMSGFFSSVLSGFFSNAQGISGNSVIATEARAGLWPEPILLEAGPELHSAETTVPSTVSAGPKWWGKLPFLLDF